jgi:hypothetical protein
MAALGLYVYRRFEDNSDRDPCTHFNLLDCPVADRVQLFEEPTDRGAEEEIRQVLLGPASLDAVELHAQQHLRPWAEHGLTSVHIQAQDLAEAHPLALANEGLTRRRKLGKSQFRHDGVLQTCGRESLRLGCRRGFDTRSRYS